MTYRIARDGTIYGPYSTAEVLRHMAAGAIVPTDLAQSDGQQEWLTVAIVFPATPVPAQVHPGGMPHLFADPPDLPWWRVVRSDGTWPKGAEQRARLLAEDVPIRGQRVVMAEARIPPEAIY